MKVTVQVVFDGDDESTAVREVFALKRGAVTPDTLGLQLAEAKVLRCAVQETVVDAQVKDTLAAQAACPHCATPRRPKDIRAVVVRTLLGTLQLPSPRWWHCPCQPQPSQTFRPLDVFAPAAAEHARAVLPAGQVRRPGVLRDGRHAAGRTPAPRPTPCTPRRSVGRPRSSRSAGKTSSAPSSPAASTAVSETGRRCPARASPCSSASTVATSTPASNSPAGTDGSR
jgi:hypothetical protein